MLKDRIYQDIVAAMKAKDKDKLSVLRMLKGSLQLENINKGKELTDDVVIDVISREIKQRKESIAEFTKGGREDLANETAKEIDILKAYLPEQLSEEEIEKIINQVFASVAPTSAKDMGKVMKEVTPLVKGKADMSHVSALIKERLN